MRIILFIIFSIVFSQPTVADTQKLDGTSQQAFQQSSKEIAATLSKEDKDLYLKGMIALATQNYPPARGLQGLDRIQILPEALAAAHLTMGGKTANELIAAGKEVVSSQK